jgi:hypothetical protein
VQNLFWWEISCRFQWGQSWAGRMQIEGNERSIDGNFLLAALREDEIEFSFTSPASSRTAWPWDTAFVNYTKVDFLNGKQSTGQKVRKADTEKQSIYWMEINLLFFWRLLTLLVFVGRGRERAPVSMSQCQAVLRKEPAEHEWEGKLEKCRDVPIKTTGTAVKKLIAVKTMFI